MQEQTPLNGVSTLGKIRPPGPPPSNTAAGSPPNPVTVLPTPVREAPDTPSPVSPATEAEVPGPTEMPDKASSIPDTPPDTGPEETLATDSPAFDKLSDAKVKRAQFTNGIYDREPIDHVGPVLPTWDPAQEPRQIFFFTELTKLDGHTIYHRWKLNDELVGEIPFEVGSSWRWRVYSSKTILPTMTGQWRVAVVDELGNVLHSQGLTVEAQHPTPESE